ncbi:hypothetical protein RHSIM_Rhsim06G0088400 [Rhododendron simsii]|uniref:Histone-lysine N-methyltransferase ASHH2 n=1 Tax=Rhododendron simsii TaxID=118357 RepID=A0A834GVY4_RHOSS|nr:hypothetical protein RHSIM_Rhsim06G0088400 [Rhododendron simsii]
MLTGILPLVENVCCFKDGSSKFNLDCVVETSRLPLEENACIFKEGSSTMDPSCAGEELSGSLLSCEPCSVTDKDPCKSLVAPDISGTEVLVGALNSISIVDSSGLIDDEGNDNVKFDDVPVVKFPDTSCSVSSGRSALTAKSNQKTLTRNTARERGKTIVEKPLLDSVLLRVARKRRSYLCKPARSSVWGSWGYITQVFEKNGGYDVNQNGRTKSQKARGVGGSGKWNKNHSQSSRGKSCTSSGHIRLKVTLGREVIQSCLTDMVSNTDGSLRNYRGTSIEVLKSKEGSENKINEEVPGINGYKCRNQDQEKVMMSSDATHLGLCVLNKALEIPTIDEKSTAVNADNHHTLSSQVVVDNRYLDSGTSPDSEVINLIQEAQVNGKVQEDLYDVLSSSQACVAPGDVTDLEVSQISSKKGKNKNKILHVDNSSVEDRLPLPEIINNEIGLEIQGHEEKMGDVFYSSKPSISTTIANVSGNTLSSEGFSRGPLSSSRVTDGGVPFENFKVEGGEEDIYFRHGLGIQSVDSNICDKLHLDRKTNGRKHFKTSKSIRASETGSEASDSPSGQTGNACKQKGNTVKSVCRRKGIDKGPCGEVTCKVENYPETGDHASADPEKVKTENESTTKNVFDLDTVPKCIGEQNLPPQSAWVCCDACLKWRRIPATLADVINETNGRWICHDNMDKGFADCSIAQEMSNSEINAELQISDVSCGEDGSDAHLNSNRLESKHSAVHPRSSWMLIKSNLFLHRTRKRQTIDEIMVCHCKPPQDGKMGCADGCLNRMLNIECVRGTCPCADLCSNQQFQKRKYANLNRVRCGKKGYGLETKEDIREGRFLIEYVGEVLDMQAYEARQREYASMGHKHFYFMTLNGSEVIDACAKGNLGRFINHSCDPNCRTEKWMVNGEVCIGLFALRDIKKGEELTFDYNYVRVFGAAAKECVCGSSQCRGYLGGDPQNTEAIVKDDSDEEYPEPVMFYEDGEIDDNWKHLISAASSFDTTEKMADHRLGNKDKMSKSAIVGGHVESIRELQIAGLSATAVHPLEITAGSSLIKSASGAQLHDSLEVDNSVEGLLPVLQEETCSQLDHKSNKPISEAQKGFVQGLETSLQSVVSKPLSDAVNSKKKFKSDSEDRHESKAHPRLRTSRSPSSVKKGKSSSNSLKIDKSGLMVNKSNVLPYKSRKIMESSLNNRFEAVEEKLNELLDADGGISKRKDATKGYLKLLLLTATSGDSGNGEAIQSNRDLSMILDALLKTRSRIVLFDIISKNGLQMLHNIMKRYRRNFNKIPILRKLLKVLEYLAVREILTLEHINGGPRCLGVESFRESILTLTEHDDKQSNILKLKWTENFDLGSLSMGSSSSKPNAVKSSSSSLPSSVCSGGL